MAVAANPTPTSIVTQALKRAGRVNPTPAQITEALENALQDVKADIMLVAPTHPNLKASATTYTTRGQQRYSIPADSNEQISLLLLDSPDEWRGTVSGGSGSNVIILDSSLTASADDIVGKYILITSGNGAEEYREIISYSPGSHTAIVDIDWLNAPTIGSTYLIANQITALWPVDTMSEFDLIRFPFQLGTPRIATLHEQEFLLYPVPDKVYGLMNRYWVDLSSVDEASELFTQLLREWRSIWIQGVAVKTMQRFDEDRYAKELEVYTGMLAPLAQQASGVTQMRFFNV